MKKLPAAARSMAHVAHMHSASIRRAATAMLAPPAERFFLGPLSGDFAWVWRHWHLASRFAPL